MSDSLPDYCALVRFLVEPLLDQPGVLKVDCETHPHNSRVWVRVAFEGADKGKVFGRGGRTIQAIRTVVTMAGKAAGQIVHLEVFGEREHRESRNHEGRSDRADRERRPRPGRPSTRKPNQEVESSES